jgi:hypothetical protein
MQACTHGQLPLTTKLRCSALGLILLGLGSGVPLMRWIATPLALEKSLRGGRKA